MKEKINGIRKSIKDIASLTKKTKEEINQSEVTEQENRGEVMANITLTYRHLEDASMRLGKVLQAMDGGISVYDKDTTVGV